MAETKEARQDRWLRRGTILSRVALYATIYGGIGLMMWKSHHQAAPTGQALQQMIQEVQRVHALAIRGGDVAGQCTTAKRLVQLYAWAHDSAAEQVWKSSTKAACARYIDPLELGR